jgi:hypothetical protein
MPYNYERVLFPEREVIRRMMKFIEYKKGRGDELATSPEIALAVEVHPSYMNQKMRQMKVEPKEYGRNYYGARLYHYDVNELENAIKERAMKRRWSEIC